MNKLLHTTIPVINSSYSTRRSIILSRSLLSKSYRLRMRQYSALRVRRSLSEDKIFYKVRLIRNIPVALRNSWLVSQEDVAGIRQVYVRPQDVRFWIPSFLKIASNVKLTPIDRAALLYAVTLLYHPLIDGNGRFARLLACVSLYRSGCRRICLATLLWRLEEEKWALIASLRESVVRQSFAPILEAFQDVVACVARRQR